MLQRDLQDFVHGLDEMNGHLRLDFRRNIRQIFFIVLRQNHGAQAEAVRGQQLFLHAADGQHFAAQA